MALSDDLKDYIAQNSDAKTAIPDQHSVFIVGETHAPTEDMTGKSAVRTNSSTRLVQELLFDPKFRYYGSEYLDNAGCLNIGTGVFSVATTPEPGSLSFMATGLIAVLVTVRRKIGAMI